MWNLKTTTVPVIVRTLDMIKKGIDKYIDKIPGSYSLHEIQKIALCGTVHFHKDSAINVTGKYFPRDAGKI